MARGLAVPAPEPIPVVDFTRIKDDELSHIDFKAVLDGTCRSHGFTDPIPFERPEQYIRYIEPLESDLAIQVEYDMDEQDQEWLDAINAERKDTFGPVTYEAFEVLMDRLEKDYFDLTKNIPKPEYALPSEDSTCNICDDSEGENSNAIVFCDGCNLAVHQDCYGVPYIPEGQWLCRKCTVSPDAPVCCVLCPNEGGAFKQTVKGDWAHLLCAIWIPETRVANESFMEPIVDVDKISRQRWKLKCSICRVHEGACIQCTKGSCFVAFHVTCARKEKLLLPMKSAHGSDAPPLPLTCYCERHLPLELQESRLKALEDEQSARDSDTTSTAVETNGRLNGRGQKPLSESKSARAYAKSYNVGAPLVPAIIVERIIAYTRKFSIKDKTNFVHLVCKYWSLKREARRGAPLLKRLHLEPWTGGKVLDRDMSDLEKRMRLEQLMLLKQDLEHVRKMADLCRKRETRKHWQAHLTQELLLTILFPHEEPLREAFEKVTSLDKNHYFEKPVTKVQAEDYLQIVKHPMCWNVIEAKLGTHGYSSVASFKDDVELVLNNAILYNKPHTPYYKTAARLKDAIKPIFSKLETLATPLSALYTQQEEPAALAAIANDTALVVKGNPLDPDNNAVQDQEMDVLPTFHSKSQSRPPPPLPPPLTIPSSHFFHESPGDLEPPICNLKILTSQAEIQRLMDVLITSDPLDSLFSYEIAEDKPREPTPPPPLPSSKSKAPKRDRKTDGRGRRRQNAANTETLEQQQPDAVIPESAAEESLDATLRVDSGAELDGAPVLDVSDVLASSKNPPSTRRTPHGHAIDDPPVVDNVSDRQTFSHFDKGWIFLEGQKRKRTPANSEQAVLPQKKLKTDHKQSRLSAIASAESENQTLMGTSPRRSGVSSKGTTTELDEDSTTRRPSENPADEVQAKELGPQAIQMPDGVVIVGELDTPETRRAKKQLKMGRRKREVQGVDPSLVHGSVPGPSFSQAPLSPAHRALQVKSPGLSDLTELSESEPVPVDFNTHWQNDVLPGMSTDIPLPESEMMTDGTAEDNKKTLAPDDHFGPDVEVSDTASEDGQVVADALIPVPPEPQSASPEVPVAFEVAGQERPAADNLPDLKAKVIATLRSKPQVSAEMARKALNPVPEDLEVGTLVWAKLHHFPWWPAGIEDPDAANIPPSVVKEGKKRRKKSPNSELHLVQFYEDKQSWSWLSRDRLRMLYDDPALDLEMLTQQKWSKNARQNEFFAAYSLAVSHVEDDDIEQERAEALPSPSAELASSPAEDVKVVPMEMEMN